MATRNSRTFLPTVGTSRGSFQSSITPRSTYVQPANETSGLRGLAAALGVVGKVADRKQTLKDEQDKQRGYMAGILDSAKNDPANIKSKTMYPQESHAFMLAHKESVAKAWAMNRIAEWKGEYETWEDKDSNNPNAFKGWFSEKLNEAQSAIGGDPYSLQGAMPSLMEAMHNMTATHAKYTANRIIDDETKAVRMISRGLIENWNTENPSHPSYDPKGEALLAAIDTQIAISGRKGLSAGKVKDQIFQDILDMADATNDERLFGLILEGDGGGILKLTPDQMVKAEQAYQDYTSERDAEAAAVAKEAKAQKKEQEDTFLGTYMTQYAMGNFKSVPTPAEAQAFPKIYKEIMAARSSMRGQADYINPVLENNILTGINNVIFSEEFKNKPLSERLAIANALVKDKQLSASTLMSVYRTASTDPKDPKITANNPTIKSLHTASLKNIKGSLDIQNDMGVPVTNFGTEFEARMSNVFVGLDLTGKTPSEIQQIYNTEAQSVLTQMLTLNPALMDRVSAALNQEQTGVLDDKVVTIGPMVKMAYAAVLSEKTQASKALKEAIQAEAEADAVSAKAQEDAKAALQAILAETGAINGEGSGAIPDAPKPETPSNEPTPNDDVGILERMIGSFNETVPNLMTEDGGMFLEPDAPTAEPERKKPASVQEAIDRALAAKKEADALIAKTKNK